jgi:UDP-glucose 4-epimerase
MRCFVTGGEGFLGRHVAARLAADGDHVISIGIGGLSTRQQTEVGFRGVVRGLIDAALLGQSAQQYGDPDVIIHAAGSSSVGDAAADPSRSFAWTVTSTHEVIEFARQLLRKPRIVLISSAAVYGNYGHSPIPVNAPYAPISTYGLHKAAAERILLDALHAYGLDGFVVRFFSLYGPHLRKQLLWDVLVRVFGGEDPLRLDATGTELRDFLFISDATELVRMLANGGSPMRIVNGARGEPIALATLVTKLIKMAGLATQIEFSGVDRPGNPPSLVADVDCLDACSFRTQVSLDDGLKQYMQWALSELLPRAVQPSSSTF